MDSQLPTMDSQPISAEDEQEDKPSGRANLEKMETLFASDGAFAHYIKGYQPRAAQIAMAAEIDSRIQAPEDSADLVIEAGTGIGKTLSYVVPAILSDKKILIATATRYLQDQLYARDLIGACAALGIKCDKALLKGRASYLCWQRMEQAVPSKKQSIQRLHDLRQWASQSRHGDLDKYDGGDIDSELRTSITSTTDNCLGRQCDFYNDCFVYKARKQAMQAQLIVTNHHLVLNHIQARDQGWGELLPEVDVCIFDEAHKLLSVASDVYTTSISTSVLHETYRELKNALANENDASATTMISVCEQALEKINQLLFQFTHELQEGAPPADDWGAAPRRSSQAVLQEIENETDFDLNAALQKSDLREAVQELINKTGDLLNVMQDKSEIGDNISRLSRRVASAIEQLQQIFDSCLNERTDVVSYFRLQAQSVQLSMIPFDFSQIFSQQIKQLCTVAIYTSATLKTYHGFEYFTKQLGLLDAKCLSFASEFNYQEQSILWLPDRRLGLIQQQPDPDEPCRVQDMKQSGRKRHVIDLIQAIAPILTKVSGRSMILLTSRQALQYAKKELRSLNLPMEIFVQGDQPSSVLMNRFLQEQPAVLLGLATFWEGVDIKGSNLVFLVIDKLPFDPPYTPVNLKRSQFMQRQQQDFFSDYLLPKAILRLKQGVGRLIRDLNDYGIIAVADPRLVSKNYGRLFLESIPAFHRTHAFTEVMEFADNHCVLPPPESNPPSV